MTDMHRGNDASEPPPRGYPVWRRVHLLASWLLCLLAIVHSGVTFTFASPWSADSAWFLGAGLGLLLLASLNIALIGVEPCRWPGVRFLQGFNWLYAAFGGAAAYAVRELPGYLVLACLVAQALASRWTLPGGR
ncbi:MAG: hypothetical protein M3N43_14985 [Actinomycetota bacterium]|nr:hypothetical protein [Actinomycetota bacterium]